MNTEYKPEITLRVILLSVFLTLVLAMSNAYLALKVGILTSASIPAALISMGILRLLRNPSVLENNLVQTAASAGEAVAGGIVYTIPALIIIHYWNHFPYIENFLIALIGGFLGVFFSIPLRRILVRKESGLPFPEGKAIAEVLKIEEQSAVRLRYLIIGSGLGAFLEFCQSGLKIIASSWQGWWSTGRGIFGFGVGFSSTMIGAGYLIGFNIGGSIFLGAVIGWFLGVPLVSHFYGAGMEGLPPSEVLASLWRTKISYIGISAMLVAGVFTVGGLLKPLYANVKKYFNFTYLRTRKKKFIAPNDRDIPLGIVLLGLVLILIGTYFFLAKILPLNQLGLAAITPGFLGVCVLYLLVIGFIFSAITGYFSGLVGVTASPGSAIIIAGLLIAALAMRTLLTHLHVEDSNAHLLNAEAIVIILGALITGAAAIANDNIQDLKVGYLLGATPWKQQIMLLFGVTISALVIPLVMQLLFSVYGIADVMPYTHVGKMETLPAPPAALMSLLTKGVFERQLPWPMIFCGAGISLATILGNIALQRRHKKVSVLGVAIGIYLPLSSSIPLFIGSLFSFLVKRYGERFLDGHARYVKLQESVLLACGLIAGSVLVDVILAIPFSISGNTNLFAILPETLSWIPPVVGIVVIAFLGRLFYKTIYVR